MKRSWILAGGVAVVLAGCDGGVSPDIGDRGFPEVQSVVDPVVTPPQVVMMPLAEAKARGDQLKIGMTQEQVEALFGRPHASGARTFGAQTGTPWTGWEWGYSYGRGQTGERLSIGFQKVDGQWLVNHGEWY